MGYNWLYGNKVIFCFVNVDDKEFLVCANNLAFNSIKFVEDAKTGKRIFPTQEQKNNFVNDADGLVKMLTTLIN